MNFRSILKRGFAKISASEPLRIKMTDMDPHLIPSNIALPTETTAAPEELLFTFQEMYKMRRMEQKADALYKERLIKGFCHLYNGQEGLGVGLEMGLTYQDHLITAYRDHVQAYLRGISVYEIFCEMMGKKDGSSKAKGGSMHFYKKKNNFYGGNGIVGAQVPVGVGLGFALKYKKNKENVAIAMYGDGAANQGQIYEAANMASLWKLPVILLCEMNFYAMGTSVERSSTGGNAFHKKIYNVPGIKVNGQDVFEMREATRFAKKFAIENGPIIMNVHTYRYQGHSMSDPGTTYRVKEFDAFWRREMDPVKIARQRLLDTEVSTEEEIAAMEKEIKRFIDHEIERAMKCESAPLDYLLEDVYDPSDKMFVRAPNYDDSVFIKEKLIN